MAEAELQKADLVMTQGATQSNHARQTAAFAAKLGMACHISCWKTAPDPRITTIITTAMCLLDHLHGATTEKTSQAGLDMQAEMEARRQGIFEAEGKKVYIIPGRRIQSRPAPLAM